MDRTTPGTATNQTKSKEIDSPYKLQIQIQHKGRGSHKATEADTGRGITHSRRQQWRSQENLGGVSENNNTCYKTQQYSLIEISDLKISENFLG